MKWGILLTCIAAVSCVRAPEQLPGSRGLLESFLQDDDPKFAVDFLAYHKGYVPKPDVPYNQLSLGERKRVANLLLHWLRAQPVDRIAAIEHEYWEYHSTRSY